MLCPLQVGTVRTRPDDGSTQVTSPHRRLYTLTLPQCLPGPHLGTAPALGNHRVYYAGRAMFVGS